MCAREGMPVTSSGFLGGNHICGSPLRAYETNLGGRRSPGIRRDDHESSPPLSRRNFSPEKSPNDTSTSSCARSDASGKSHEKAEANRRALPIGFVRRLRRKQPRNGNGACFRKLRFSLARSRWCKGASTRPLPPRVRNRSGRCAPHLESALRTQRRASQIRRVRLLCTVA